MRAIQAFSLLGIIICLDLLYIKWGPQGGSEWCSFGNDLNCDIVNQSIYADFLGIEWLPNALMGLITYIIILLFATAIRRNWNFHKIHKWLSSIKVLKATFYLSLIGTLFQLYLSYIEAYVLMTWCILCIVSQFLIAIICLLCYITLLKIGSHTKKSKVCEFC